MRRAKAAEPNAKATKGKQAAAPKRVAKAKAVPDPRGKDGRFTPGVSGCPGGRPKGSKTAPAEIRLSRQVQREARRLVAELLERSRAGDPDAQRLVIETGLRRRSPPMQEDAR
jgi:hypothetical protein